MPNPTLYENKRICAWPAVCKEDNKRLTKLFIGNARAEEIELKKGLILGHREPPEESEFWPEAEEEKELCQPKINSHLTKEEKTLLYKLLKRYNARFQPMEEYGKAHGPPHVIRMDPN